MHNKGLPDWELFSQSHQINTTSGLWRSSKNPKNTEENANLAIATSVNTLDSISPLIDPSTDRLLDKNLSSETFLLI